MSSKKAGKKNVDMQQLADMAGVARSTVSRALNDSPLVNERTKEKIRKLAEEHNFVMNETARNLRLQRSNMICLVLMHDAELGHRLSDPFFLRMVGCVVDQLAVSGHDLMLYHKPVDTAAEFLGSRAYRQCDGAIFIGQGSIHEELNRLADYSKPLVVWGADLPDRDYPIVGTNNVHGGELATRHLIEQGCRHIAFLGDRDKPELGLRHQGYARALREAGFEIDPELELAAPMERGAAEVFIDSFLRGNPDIDGMVCCSDMLAASAISCLQRHGIAVPSEVAVTGYDDLEIGSRIHPTLTTVSQNIQEGARLLIENLMGMLAGKRIRDSIRDSHLVIRESSLRPGK